MSHRFTRSTAALGLALCFLLAPACSTVDTRTNAGYSGTRVYSGTAAALSSLGRALGSLRIDMFIMHMIDLPFSMVADTLLLPITIPEQGSRDVDLERLARVDTDVPSPFEFDPTLSRERNAEELFDACMALFLNLDPRLTDCYAVGANILTIEGGVTTQMTGAEYKLRMRDSIARIEDTGNFVKYRNPVFTRADDEVRIEATRVSSFDNQRNPVSLLIGPSDDGEWRIQEEIGGRWP